jgi:DNA-binding transcriptional LysR family regulator
MRTEQVNLNRMTVFAAVVRQGSFTAAADALGSTKSMVSQQLTRLEQELGVKLLQRSTRRLALTEAGDLYYQACTRILAEAATVTAELQRMRDEPTGRLRVTAPSDMVVDVLVPLAADFIRHYPRVEVELLAHDRIPDMIEERIDLAIRTHSVEDSRLYAARIADFEQIVCAAPAYLRQIAVPCEPPELERVDWISLLLLEQPRRWTFTGPGGKEQTVRTASRMAVNSAAALRACLLQGLGVSVVPGCLVHADLAEGRLVRLLPGYRLPEGGIYSVTLSARQAPRKVLAFIEFLKARFGQREPEAVAPS